jgi:hypothetical protein
MLKRRSEFMKRMIIVNDANSPGLLVVLARHRYEVE